MRSLLAALALFTTIPAPTLHTVDRAVARRAILAFPWLGLLLGAAAGAALFGLDKAGAAPLLGAVVAVGLLAWATGALHLDGLADTADGLGSRKPAEEALRIMRRSDIGPMGVVTLVFVLLLDVGALVSSDPAVAWAAVAAGALLARAAVVVATVPGTSARESGFGALVIGVTRAWAAAVTVVAGLVVVAGLGWLAAGPWRALWFTASAGVALAAGTWWARRLRVRLGGLTGDTFGSVIELTQAIFLVTAAITAG